MYVMIVQLTFESLVVCMMDDRFTETVLDVLQKKIYKFK